MMTDSQFRQLTEQYQTLSTQIAGVAERQNRLEEVLGRFIEHTDERFRSLETRLTRVEVRVEAMQDDVKAVAEGVQNVWERLVRFEESTGENFARVDRRLTVVEAKVA